MKTSILKTTVLFAVIGLLGAAEQGEDIYQQNVAPDLVNNVNLAKEKQVNEANLADLKQAESLLTDVLKQKPDYYRALYNLGQVYESEGNHEKAIKTFEKAKEVRDREGIPDNSILNALGSVYLNAANLDKAEDYLKAAYEASPNELVLNNLGYLYLQKDQPAEARKYLTEAKDKFHQPTADTLLKVVDDYERLYQMWAVYGERVKASEEWLERHFDVQGGNKMSIPKPKDTVIARDSVFIRSSAPVWDDATQDLKVGSHFSNTRPGDRVLVLRVIDTNSPTDKNAYYFIRLARLPPGPVSDEEARTFVRRHMAATENGDLEALMATYAPQVDYYNDGVKNRDYIHTSQKSYIDRHEHRKFTLGAIDIIRDDTSESNNTVRVRFSFRYKVSVVGQRDKTGNGSDLWIIRRDGDQMHIIDCKETVRPD